MQAMKEYDKNEKQWKTLTRIEKQWKAMTSLMDDL
jgi:hypothetical protein